MKISILIPCFNELKTIEKIIDKVIEQTNHDKEIIVIDDYSNDGTRALLKDKLKSKINIIIFNEKNYGKGYS